MAKGRRATGWAYSTGERGANRVRAFERGARGIYLEWFEVSVPGGPRTRRTLALKHSDRVRAKAQADEVAARFRRAETPVRERQQLTLAQLFETYEREVTPHKGRTAQAHDARCFEMFLRAFGRDRRPAALSRLDWDRFIADRRAGRLAPAKAKPGARVRDRAIQQDLQTLRAVLNWATTAGDGSGGVLLDRNPLAGLTIPREESPRRAVLTVEQFTALRGATAGMPAWMDCFLVLAWETGHRAASIRQLRWADVDLEGQRVHCRGETDKIGNDHWSPLTTEAVAALRREQQRTGAIGETWIFTAARDPRRCASGDAVFNLWKRLAARAKLPKGERYGWHSLRRRFANDLRHVPLRDLADLGGWKTAQTILTCYQQPDEAAQRAALATRGRPLQAVSGAR